MDATNPVRAVVIGGGITGLAVAYRFQNRLNMLGRPFQVTLLEAGSRVGGIIQTQRRDGFLLESGPDCFLREKPRAEALAQDLGISRELIETQPDYRRSFIYFRKRLLRVPKGFYLMAPTDIESLIMTPLLSWKGKFRMLKEIFIPLEPKEDETLASFVRRRLGQEALERLAQPLIAGIYGADPETLSLRSTFPQFLEMEKRGGILRYISGVKNANASTTSGARYNLFLSFQNGMQQLVDTLATALGPQIIQTGKAVQSLTPLERGRWHIALTDGSTLEADAVCVALPAPAAARLVAPFDTMIAKNLTAVPYAHSLTVHWAFKSSQVKDPTNGAGFVVPRTEKKSLGACTFVHRKFRGRVPEGHALFRGFVGGHALASLWPAADDDVQKRLLAELREMLGISGAPLFSTVHRASQAMPQYALGHHMRVKEVDERLSQWPGLALAGNWRIGVGVPDSIESGERAAEGLIQQLCRI